MVLIDICVLSGLSYSIFGNIIHYIKTKSDVENNIKELNDETQILRICDYVNNIIAPSFVNMGSPGIMIPFGDGSYEELRKQLCLLRNNDKNITIKQDEASETIIYDIKYINTQDDLQNIYKIYSIDNTMFPVKFPLKIYEKTTTDTIYYNSSYFDLKKTNVLRKTLIDNKKPYTFIILGCSALVLGCSWLDYKWCYNDNNYPIFHPKRYNYKNNIKAYIKSWID